MLAARLGHRAALELLLRHGADPARADEVPFCDTPTRTIGLASTWREMLCRSGGSARRPLVDVCCCDDAFLLTASVDKTARVVDFRHRPDA